ncbi:type II toxin-antitoxin system VapB family antitoxin [Siccirubricoccus sp. G192]|uniref:type II toxin-antitoxin system VapB family antitoxin n=1 Tax=Siccirubricoccus sp. G192 TaxID=2849651 RepID=UPI001C2CC219|nr:type II toxin-antitoxin system VapB family antitoxin [Siccirubricoccus sp. G192]MBV1796771.1 type II toxin-antitoxin system VapB family antitoxin [Siccirubricoccus sp. G192]
MPGAFYRGHVMGQLNLKDETLIAEAKELAALLGTTATGAVRLAVHERLERERRARGADRRAAELMEIGRRCAARLRERELDLPDHDTLLYDPATGLPR